MRASGFTGDHRRSCRERRVGLIEMVQPESASDARPEPPPAPRPAYVLTVRALAAFVLLDVGFWSLGFDRILRLVLHRPARPARRRDAEDRQQAQRTFRAVQHATMLYYRRGEDCLPKALATFHLLRRQGIPAELCFAVKKFPFAAHSWVEAYGEALDDRPARLRQYTVIHRVSS